MAKEWFVIVIWIMKGSGHLGRLAASFLVDLVLSQRKHPQAGNPDFSSHIVECSSFAGEGAVC